MRRLLGDPRGIQKDRKTIGNHNNFLSQNSKFHNILWKKKKLKLIWLKVCTYVLNK